MNYTNHHAMTCCAAVVHTAVVHIAVVHTAVVHTAVVHVAVVHVAVVLIHPTVIHAGRHIMTGMWICHVHNLQQSTGRCLHDE